MATYDNLISRTNAESLIPEEVSREIIQGIPEQSMIMRLGRRLPDMPRNKTRLPVLSVLPIAGFVTGDTGLKATSKVEWANKFLNAEELAVIVPIPESVLADADYDIWGEVRPRIVEAMGATFDAAVIHGTNAPDSWPDDLVTSATAAGNSVTVGSVGVDLYDDIMGVGGLLAKVEDDGFMVNGHLAALSMRARLRGLRDSNGLPIFVQQMQDRQRYELDGEPIEFARNGALDPAAALMVSGDFQQLVYAIRQDITFKIADQGTLQDNAGNTVINLFQQDAIAMRVVMRIAWQVPNPINRVQQTEASRYPFAVLKP